MTIKKRLIIFGLPALWRAHRARKMFKKTQKSGKDQPFSEQFKNDWLLKKAKKIAKLLKVELKIEGWDNLPKAPALLAPNHASNFDAALVFIALANPQLGKDYLNIKSVFLAKKELQTKKFFIFKGYMGLINTFFIDRKNIRQSLEEMQKFFTYAKKEKKMAVLFPSGTRNLEGKVGEFKAGAFKLAKKEFMPIVPVTINNSLDVVNWSRKKPIKVEVIFGKTIKPALLLTTNTQNIAQRVQAAVLQNWKEPQNNANKAR